MIALLSNITVESLALRAKKLLGEEVLTVPGFDAWRGALLDPASPVWGDGIGPVCLLLHGPALFPEGVNAGFEGVLSEALSVIEQARDTHKDRVFVVSTLDLPASPALPLAGADFAARAAAFWRSELEKMGLPVLDLRELAAEVGRDRFYSAKMWYFGSLPFSQQGETLLAGEIARIENAIRGGRRKCLVLDLDNTLWGGVVGEDGLEGISLASGGMGSQYRDAQRVAKELSEQGVLLAVASKNNLEDALLPFRNHPHMLLREDDFVKIKADWNPKPANIAAIAEELNIGLDALVFVDDNPVEREAVKAALPEVAVPDFPEDSSRLPAFMADLARTYFTALRLADEDRRKTAMYRAESKREAAKNAHRTLDEYLASLEMKLDLHALREDEVARAAQLTQKTNQFNLTTKRYTEADIAAMLRDPGVRIRMAELKDRFGDYGRVCLAIVRVDAGTAEVDTFLMSCRVMGRGVEDAVLSKIEKELAAEGVTTIRGTYVETSKNAPVRDFWSRMDYAPEDGRWVLRVPFKERKTWICRNS